MEPSGAGVISSEREQFAPRSSPAGRPELFSFFGPTEALSSKVFSLFSRDMERTKRLETNLNEEENIFMGIKNDQ